MGERVVEEEKRAKEVLAVARGEREVVEREEDEKKAEDEERLELARRDGWMYGGMGCLIDRPID